MSFFGFFSQYFSLEVSCDLLSRAPIPKFKSAMAYLKTRNSHRAHPSLNLHSNQKMRESYVLVNVTQSYAKC